MGGMYVWDLWMKAMMDGGVTLGVAGGRGVCTSQHVHDMFHSVILETVGKGGWTDLAKPFVQEMFRPARSGLVGTGEKVSEQRAEEGGKRRNHNTQRKKDGVGSARKKCRGNAEKCWEQI